VSPYKAYPEYRESGLIGLGKIPVAWPTQKIKYIFNIGRGRVISQEELDDSEYPVYSSQTMNDGCLGYIATYDFDCSQITWTTDGANAGTVFLRNGKHNCTNVCGTLQPKITDENLKYFLYCLEYVTQFYKRPDTNGAKIMNGEMAEIAVTLPTNFEKDKIAVFLDHETAKIDALIEKQQRLIELLKEKRQAVISHAVTKGLNPNAPMKNSGVEWLGEVPAHWQVAPLKRFADVVDCKHYTVQFLDEGLPIVSIRELRDDSIDISNAKLTTRSEWNFLREGRVPRLGDIVFCRNASVGAAGYVNGDFDFCMGQDVCLIRTGLANRYMHFQITARHVREQIEAFLVGATIRRANVEEIRGLVVAFPPENEQKAIEKHLETVLSEFDALSEKAGRTVVLLIERRTALISAAVTGKIDVRDWQAAA
jgi:type I restriction enzyme, S subunit